MPQVTVPASIAVVLPFIVAVLTSILKDDKLPAWLNALIAFVALLGTSIACEYLTGGFDNHSSLIIVTGILAYVVYLLRNDYQTLLQFLYVKNSPVAPSTPASTSPAAVQAQAQAQVVAAVQQANVTAQPVVAQTPVAQPVAPTPAPAPVEPVVADLPPLETLMGVTVQTPAITPQTAQQ